jgi:hypothetical protein
MTRQVLLTTIGIAALGLNAAAVWLIHHDTPTERTATPFSGKSSATPARP